MAGKPSTKVYPGAVFGKLTVVKKLPRDKNGYYRTLCKCECGNTTEPVTAALGNGSTKSCGCYVLAPPGIGYGKIIPGARFDRLTVVKRIKRDGKLTNRVKCICDCGKHTRSNIDGLVNGNVKSCGCYQRDVTIKRNKETAKFKCFSSKYPKTFNTWACMMARCNNPKHKSYQFYGDKGVMICKYLRETPDNLKKLIGLRKKDKPTIDRFPIHNGNYTCGQCKECTENEWKLNVRWASRKEQSNNRGDFNVYLEAFGKRMTIGEWRDLTGIHDETIRTRLEHGWSHEKAVSVPDPQGNCYKP